MRNKKPYFLVCNSVTWASKRVPSFDKGKTIVDSSRTYDHIIFFNGHTHHNVYQREEPREKRFDFEDAFHNSNLGIPA